MELPDAFLVDDDLRFAAANGDIAEIERLLNEGRNPNSFDELGWSALHHAVTSGHADAVRFLLEHGADVNANDESRIGNTPLAEVASNCSLAMARLLVGAGANPTIPGWMQLTALDRARDRKRGDGPEVYTLLAAASQRWRPGIK